VLGSLSFMELRFFVIDDIEGVRDILQEYLTHLGHEVICAEHPLAAPICQKTQCNIEFACADGYFVDLSMPHMNGIDFFESLTRRGCKAPPENRVLMTGNLTQEAKDKADELGVTVVHKPLQLSKIEELVEEMRSNVDPKRRLADLPSS